MKNFIGDAKMNGNKGVNNYVFCQDDNKVNVVMLRGTFTFGEIKAIHDAMELKNQDKFKFPAEIV